VSVRSHILLCVGGIIFAMSVQAQSGPNQLLLALSKKDQTLAIVDPASLKVLARIPVGNDPQR
jgi:hypothetical protein